MHDTRGEEQCEGYRKYEWRCVGPDNDEGKVDDMGAGGCRIMHELRISVVSVSTLDFSKFSSDNRSEPNGDVVYMHYMYKGVDLVEKA